MLSGVVETPMHNPRTPKDRKIRATIACGSKGNVAVSRQHRELSVQDVYGERRIPRIPVHRSLFRWSWRKTTETPGRGVRWYYSRANATTHRDGPSIKRGTGTKRTPTARRISLCCQRGITYGGPRWTSMVTESPYYSRLARHGFSSTPHHPGAGMTDRGRNRGTMCESPSVWEEGRPYPLAPAPHTEAR